MRRKSFLVGACALALLQWGCMDYKEFSDVAVEPFRPEFVVPVAADTAYVTDVQKRDTIESVRFNDDGSVYMYYETADEASVQYKLTAPEFKGGAILLSNGNNSLSSVFSCKNNLAGLIFSAGTLDISAPTSGSVVIGGHSFTAGTSTSLAGVKLVFTETSAGIYELNVNQDCTVEFSSDAAVSSVLLAPVQTSAVFTAKSSLSHVELDMFNSNFYANQAFQKANFSIKVTPRGKNIEKIPFKFVLNAVEATYKAIDPTAYDGMQEPEELPQMFMETKDGVSGDYVAFWHAGIPVGDKKWSYYQPGNATKTFVADASNSNLVELLKSGPKLVKFGEVECQYDSDTPRDTPVEVDLKPTDNEKVDLLYCFNLPLEGAKFESLWVHDVTLSDSLPDPKSSKDFGEVSQYLDLQDDDYVKLYLQFSNRFPVDVYANVSVMAYGATPKETIEKMKLNFDGLNSVGGDFTNPNFKMFLAAKAAPKNSEGISTGETKNLVTCMIPYSQYKIMQKHAEGFRISYRIHSSESDNFKLMKTDFIYVRVGVEVRPTVSYNTK